MAATVDPQTGARVTRFDAELELDPAHPFGARIGFAAQGTLARSACEIREGVPPPGSTIGVGDAVEIVIEAEFTRPADQASKG